MTLGRMIYFYLPEQKIFGIKARRLAMYFVLLDIVSFIIQGVGGSMISPTADKNVILTGIHLYMAGIGVQEFFIAIFIVIAVTFHRRMLVLEQRGETRRRTKWLRLIVTLYAVLVMITVSIPPPSVLSRARARSVILRRSHVTDGLADRDRSESSTASLNIPEASIRPTQFPTTKPMRIA